MKNILKLFFVCIFLYACSDDNSDPVAPVTSDYSAVLNNITNNVIINTYGKLANASESLLISVNQLESNRSEEMLTQCRLNWIRAREPWEQSEGFLFGPVDTKGLDPALDSWPVNKIDLQNVLDSGDDLTSDFVGSLEGTLKGFHTIEFLLWGENGDKVIDQLSQREYEYLLACTEILAADSKALLNAWEASNDDFGRNLINAGQNGSIYISQKAALQELADGILGISDEVGNGKINDPLEQQDLSLEESQFSNNSKDDFTDNIISIKNVYTGGGSNGLQSVIRTIDADADAQLISHIDAAIQAIQGIPGTFTDAIINTSPTHQAAKDAQQAVRMLQQSIEEKLIPIISNL